MHYHPGWSTLHLRHHSADHRDDRTARPTKPRPRPEGRAPTPRDLAQTTPSGHDQANELGQSTILLRVETVQPETRHLESGTCVPGHRQALSHPSIQSPTLSDASLAFKSSDPPMSCICGQLLGPTEKTAPSYRSLPQRRCLLEIRLAGAQRPHQGRLACWATTRQAAPGRTDGGTLGPDTQNAFGV